DLHFLADGTQFSDSTRVNQIPATGRLTVLFVCGGRNGSSGPASKIKNNCAYLGEPATVACDADFFEAFIDRSGLVGELRTVPSLAASRAAAHRSLVLWILGHEMGHAVHRDRPAHFQAGAIERIVTNATLDQQIELDAD